MKYYLLYVQKLNFQVCENWRKKGNYIAGCRVVYNKKVMKYFLYVITKIEFSGL